MKIARSMSTNLICVFIITGALLISTIVLAATEEAKNKVKAVFSPIESSLIALKQSNSLNQKNIRQVLNQYLLPEVETRYFTYKVLNKNISKVPEELKIEFINELSIQLVNTYSHLLNKYSNEVINIGQASLSNSGKMAMVDITIIGKNTTNKAVVKLLQSKDKDWLFFDIEIEGISLLQSKQAEINASFNKLGIEGTLLQLKKINQKLLDD